MSGVLLCGSTASSHGAALSRNVGNAPGYGTAAKAIHAKVKIGPIGPWALDGCSWHQPPTGEQGVLDTLQSPARSFSKMEKNIVLISLFSASIAVLGLAPKVMIASGVPITALW